MRRPERRGLLPLGAVAVVTAGLASLTSLTMSGCSGPCCTYDSRPIPLLRAPQGELLAVIGANGVRGQAVLDTGTPVTVLADADATRGRIERHDLELLGGGADPAAAPVRAQLRGVTMLHGPLARLQAGGPDLVGLLGGDVLAGFSVEIGFAAPELVLWSQQPATDGFLAEAGYAVLRVRRRGASETEARSPDGIGPAGPYQFPPSMLALRACAAPAPFDRDAPLPTRCCVGDERTLATGADLSLLLGTGYGPTIISRSAWSRVVQAMGVTPAVTRKPLYIATADPGPPIEADWATLPRLALVDREADTNLNPGPCVELGRARRLEQVAVRQASNPDSAPCALPCDQDPNTSQRAQNSAAYIEVSGELAVAVVEDGNPLLGTRGALIVPDGPQIDGILGADTLRSARVEIDYRGQPARLVFSCEVDQPASCRSVGRCPRLPSAGQRHTCFPGLSAHALPAMCDNLPAACP
jgi:hypothetical protein